MEHKVRRILAVIDPTRTDQWALSKAVSIAAGRSDVEVVAYACVYSHAEAEDLDALREAELRRHRLWLDEVIDAVDTRDVTITPRIDWDIDWREAIHHAAAAVDANLVIKRASGRGGTLGGSDRRVLRTVKGDILLVNREPTSETRRVLLALNPGASDNSHRSLDETIVGIGQRIKDLQPQVELHAVTAYPDSMHYVHADDLAKRAGVDKSRAHTVEGPAARVIAQTNSELNSDIAIIGTVARKGVAGLTIGNTAEKVLGAMTSDVLVVRHQA